MSAVKTPFHISDTLYLANSAGMPVADLRMAVKHEREFILRACNSHEKLVALAERISHLNPNAGEIGDGMLHTIVLEANIAIKLAKS